MTDAIVMGGGVAGLAAATALSSLGLEVKLFEAKPFLGGRATSYPAPGLAGETPEIDNCQHILLKCCVNLRDLYRRLGVAGEVEFHREFYFIEPGGRMSKLARGVLPAPLHFTESFLSATYLSLPEKALLGRALAALYWQRKRRRDLDSISMLSWLEGQGQTPRLIQRFWRQVLVSAINVELDEMAAAHGFQVLWLGFLASADSYEMGVPRVPLGQLYAAASVRVKVQAKAAVEAFDAQRGVCVRGQWHAARAYVSALPAERLARLLPGLPVDFAAFTPSPITGIHLWFDRAVTDLPHGTLLDRTIHWFYNKEQGRYLTLVVSAADVLLDKSRQEVIDLALAELREFLPEVGRAKLLKAHVVKETRATFRARPGLEAKRPGAVTPVGNLFLAGDWTRSGWPATMEGAVRSGYLAAEAVSGFLGRPAHFLLPDIA
ncbi:MAG: hydroxysqualene dehydroxylase HpnE [Bryobacter sp.]|jgi:zeta-carotene desaturase|nr:hydroxysqualene dehydroxylase HpnE [Bryobacter sp. CoA8 C33]